MWFTSKSGKHINTDWFPLKQNTKITEEIQKNYQIRKNLEQVTDKTHNFNYNELRFRKIAKEIYNEVYSKIKLPPEGTLDYDDPVQLVNFSGNVIRQYSESGKNLKMPACYRTAGAIAAILDKKGYTDYRCYIGASSTTSEQSRVENFSNHVWIEYHGRIYETFPNHDTKDLIYHYPNVEIYFYK